MTKWFFAKYFNSTIAKTISRTINYYDKVSKISFVINLLVGFRRALITLTLDNVLRLAENMQSKTYHFMRWCPVMPCIKLIMTTFIPCFRLIFKSSVKIDRLLAENVDKIWPLFSPGKRGWIKNKLKMLRAFPFPYIASFS